MLSRSPLGSGESRALAQLALEHSLTPCPVEFHVLCLSDLTPWHHPAHYRFHYSEAWRERMARALVDRVGEFGGGRDPDLAAHVTVARLRGIPLLGPPPEHLLPDVPPADFLRAVVSDLRWAFARFDLDPVYAVLNACRVLAFLHDGSILSKDEAVPWALEKLPPQTHPALHWLLSACAATQSSPDR